MSERKVIEKMQALETERLRLEPLVPKHADALFEGLRDQRLYEFIVERPPASLSALRDRYRMLAHRRSPDDSEGWLNWALWSRIDRRYVGYVQATVYPNRSAQIAYVLTSDHWGKGFACDAVKAMVAHLGEHYSVIRALARVDTRNERSIALLEALGFERVATHRQAEKIRGAWSDEAEYQLILD
jgi:ribosomal-protein-alanine N-acetyltransferase